MFRGPAYASAVRKPKVCAVPPVYRILPTGVRSLLRRDFRFSIKRKTCAPEETPHPENPVCNKRPSRHKICPDSYLHRIKYHRKWGLSSRKTSKKPFFSLFNAEKRPLTFFCVAFRQISRLARSFTQSSTPVQSLVSPYPPRRPASAWLCKKGRDQDKNVSDAPLSRARII